MVGQDRDLFKQLLLEAGADVNAAHERGYTPLLHACHSADEDRG